MQWEFLGKQELKEAMPGTKGHLYLCSLWRTPVPGGWLVMTINSRSSDPQPMQNFYPDPEHLWTGKTPMEAAYLLRAVDVPPVDESNLLRAGVKPPQIES